MKDFDPVCVRKGNRDGVRLRLVLFLILAALLLTAAVFAAYLYPYAPDAQLFASLEPPGPEHIAGTDRLGRDLFSRILAGLRTSVLSTLVLVAAMTAAGTAAGVVCGYFGGAADGILMRISDICLAFPGLAAALGIAALLNGGLWSAAAALFAVSWPKYARLVRSRTLELKEADFVAAARVIGDSAPQIILRHILPNVAGEVLVTAVLDMGAMMMELAGLSFLGLGAKPPAAELGSMMSEGRSLLQTCPWVVLGPGAAMFAAVSVFNLLGDAVRDWLDPRGSR